MQTVVICRPATYWLKLIGLCLVCMAPGLWVLNKWGVNGVTALPLFWGGMLYHAVKISR